MLSGLPGPFFRYETYNHFIQMDHNTLVGIPWKQQVVTRVKYVFLSIVTFLLVKSQFNFEHEGMKQDLFADTSFAYRLVYLNKSYISGSGLYFFMRLFIEN